MKKNYFDKVHTWGRISSVLTLVFLISLPFIFCVYYDAFPSFNSVLSGLASVLLVFWPTAVIEVITYSPLLGAGGTYLSFVTGNITNLKMPCALNSMEKAGVTAASEEGEVLSTIAIATSSIVTTVIIAAGVLVFSPFLPKIADPSSVVYPAFQQVTPALFGALGASYFAKHWRISMLPIAICSLLFAFVPSVKIGVVIPVGVIVSLLGAHIMFKKGWLGAKN